MKWINATNELPHNDKDVLVRFACFSILANYDLASNCFIDKAGRVCPVPFDQIQWSADAHDINSHL